MPGLHHDMCWTAQHAKSSTENDCLLVLEDLLRIAATHGQETAADELEEGYRGEIWNAARGYVRPQKQGIDAARLELRSLVNETKVAC